MIPGAAGAVVLRMPPELRRELKAAARRRKLNVNDLVPVTLSDALEIPSCQQSKGHRGFHERLEQRLDER